MIDRSEELVTVFGGGGTIGRYVCEFLLKSGVRIRVAQRDPRRAYTIQPLAQVGQFGFAKADVTPRRHLVEIRTADAASIHLTTGVRAGLLRSKRRATSV